MWPAIYNFVVLQTLEESLQIIEFCHCSASMLKKINLIGLSQCWNKARYNVMRIQI
jgi:hypothetical protein